MLFGFEAAKVGIIRQEIILAGSKYRTRAQLIQTFCQSVSVKTRRKLLWHDFGTEPTCRRRPAIRGRRYDDRKYKQ